METWQCTKRETQSSLREGLRHLSSNPQATDAATGQDTRVRSADLPVSLIWRDHRNLCSFRLVHSSKQLPLTNYACPQKWRRTRTHMPIPYGSKGQRQHVSAPLEVSAQVRDPRTRSALWPPIEAWVSGTSGKRSSTHRGGTCKVGHQKLARTRLCRRAEPN